MNTIEVLMILTSQATMGVSSAPTGVWFEELAIPYYTFVEAVARLTLEAIQTSAAAVNGQCFTIRSTLAEEIPPQRLTNFPGDRRQMVTRPSVESRRKS